MPKYDLFDIRDEFGNWSVIGNKIHRQNPLNWRNTIVFRGNKSEAKSGFQNMRMKLLVQHSKQGDFKS